MAFSTYSFSLLLSQSLSFSVYIHFPMDKHEPVRKFDLSTLSLSYSLSLSLSLYPSVCQYISLSICLSVLKVDYYTSYLLYFAYLSFACGVTLLVAITATKHFQQLMISSALLAHSFVQSSNWRWWVFSRKRQLTIGLGH